MLQYCQSREATHMMFLDEQYDMVLVAHGKNNPKIKRMEEYLGIIMTIEEDDGGANEYEIVHVAPYPEEGDDAVLLYVKRYDPKIGSQLPQPTLH